MAGKRNKRAQAKKKTAATKKVFKFHPLPKAFNCPFCEAQSSCEVSLDIRRNCGRIHCTRCAESFQTPIHHLSEAIDVYNDWIGKIR